LCSESFTAHCAVEPVVKIGGTKSMDMKRWLQRGSRFLGAGDGSGSSDRAGIATPAVTVTPNVNVLRNVSDPLLGDANFSVKPSRSSRFRHAIPST
jgi:hypothetical protein